MENNLPEDVSRDLDKETEQPLGDIPAAGATTVSNPGSAVLPLMTMGGSEQMPGRNTITTTVSILSSATDGQHEPSARVKVKIKYPKDWKRPKHLKDGDVKEVAPETADQFIKMGFASLVNESNAE